MPLPGSAFTLVFGSPYIRLMVVLFIVLALGFGSTVVAYVILWIAAPSVPTARAARDTTGNWPAG